MGTAPLHRQTFSRRESEILERIAAGETDKEIAHGLGISRKTVESHLSRIYRRGPYRGRAHAVVSWLQTQGVTSAGA